ncbi:MAG: alpha/beta hydrolase [Deltaproteobacteria bacterium]|nr:alpha/beta hydrolase [Deltaproteobacteria bacterium]
MYHLLLLPGDLPGKGHNAQIVPDNVGCGRSSAALSGGYSFNEQIARLKNVASSLGLGELILVGHSLGGILATCWSAGDRSGTVTRLVNSDCFIHPSLFRRSTAGVPRVCRTRLETFSSSTDWPTALSAMRGTGP